MPAPKKLQPRTRRVNRSELRQMQSAVLKRAKGTTVIVVEARGKGREKCILDKEYFDELLSGLQAGMETAAITTNRKLYARLLQAAETIEKDSRRGKLLSMEDVFGAN